MRLKCNTFTLKTASVFVFIGLSTLFSCKKTSFNNEKELHEYVSSLSKKSETDLYTVTVKYLPAEYLTYKELKGKSYSTNEKDSLQRVYNTSRAFIINIRLKDDRLDPLKENSAGYTEYKNKLEALAFDMESFVTVEADSIEFLPVLSMLHPTQNLGGGKSVYLLFADNEKQSGLLKADHLNLIFKDEIFSTGSHKFNFSKKDLNDIPNIAFWKPTE
ncbi:MAG TPA: hypothetical protein VF691_13570 [Cytophagaceae bacterium]|jgi:hypothetical protein